MKLLISYSYLKIIDQLNLRKLHMAQYKEMKWLRDMKNRVCYSSNWISRLSFNRK